MIAGGCVVFSCLCDFTLLFALFGCLFAVIVLLSVAYLRYYGRL